MLTEKLLQLQKLNETILKDIESLIEDLCKQIEEQRGLGTTDSKNPNIFFVKFSAIASNNGILCAEYYLPHSQSEAVRKSLSGSSDYKTILQRVCNMVAEKKVCIGKESTILNNDTINCIMNSQLWKVAQEFKVQSLQEA